MLCRIVHNVVHIFLNTYFRRLFACSNAYGMRNKYVCFSQSLLTARIQRTAQTDCSQGGIIWRNGS